ncbi:MAG: DUF4836 family protein [Cytophagaceae bacterium]|nr:DUF4836 family protein [Cytophagaceae bacterium]MDW8456690.1 DUF4836 family protein [Cytophagaceae bacterium]
MKETILNTQLIRIAASLSMMFSLFDVHAQNILKYIPEDADMVFTLDMKSISSKITKEQFQRLSFYKDIVKEIKQEIGHKFKTIEEMLNDPSSTGINFDGKIYYYLKKKDKHDYDLGFLVPLSKKKKFEKFIKKIIPQPHQKIKKYRALKYIESPELILGWTNDMFFFSNEFIGSYSYTNNQKEKKTGKIKLLDKFNKPDSRRSILNNKGFTELHRLQNDFSFWMNYAAYFSSDYVLEISHDNPLKYVTDYYVKNLMKDFQMAFHLNFNKGNITAELHQFISKEYQDIFKPIYAKKFNADMLRYLSKENLIALFTFTINMEELRKFTENKMPKFNTEIWPEIIESIFNKDFDDDTVVKQYSSQIDSLYKLLYAADSPPYTTNYFDDSFSYDSTYADSSTYNYYDDQKYDNNQQYEYFDEGNPEDKKKTKAKIKKSKNNITDNTEITKTYNTPPDTIYYTPTTYDYTSDTIYTYYQGQIDSLRKKIKERKYFLAQEKANSMNLRGEDFWLLFDGDFMIALTDIYYTEKPYKSYEYDEHMNLVEVEKVKKESFPEFILVTSLKDKNIFNSVIETFKKNLSEKRLSEWLKSYDSMNITLHTYGNYMIITNNKLIEQSYKNGYPPTQHISESIQKIITDNNVLLFVNLVQLFNKIFHEEGNKKGQLSMQLISNSFKSIYVHGRFYDETTQRSTLRIDLSNSIDNSMVEILKIIDELYKINK